MLTAEAQISSKHFRLRELLGFQTLNSRAAVVVAVEVVAVVAVAAVAVVGVVAALLLGAQPFLGSMEHIKVPNLPSDERA